MILKMTIGRSARGLLDYISSAHKTDKPNTTPMFSNMVGRNARELSKEVAALRKSKPKLGKAAAHLMLSQDPTDRLLTVNEWERALQLALQSHGAHDAPFVAYLHTDKTHQHLHCFFSGSDMTGLSCRTAKVFGKTKRLLEGSRQFYASNHQHPNPSLTNS